MSKPKKKQLAVAVAPVAPVPPPTANKDSPTLEGATYKPEYMQEREALTEFVGVDNARLVLDAFDALKEPGDAAYRQMLMDVSDDALMQAAATIAAASLQKFVLDDIWNAVERVRDELAKANRFRYGG